MNAGSASPTIGYDAVVDLIVFRFRILNDRLQVVVFLVGSYFALLSPVFELQMVLLTHCSCISPSTQFHVMFPLVDICFSVCSRQVHRWRCSLNGSVSSFHPWAS